MSLRVPLAVVATLVVCSGTAAAQTFNMVSGRSVTVANAYTLNPDCTLVGQPVIRVTQAPQHGRVTIRSAAIFPNFPASNPRSACNTRRVKGLEAVYVSERGYLGSDSVGLETIFGSGNYRQTNATIIVR